MIFPSTVLICIEMSDLLCKTAKCQTNEKDDVKTTRVQFVLRNDSQKHHFLLDCSPDETVSVIKARLGKRIGANPALLRVIFCGQSIADGVQLSALELGPTTALTLMSTAPSVTLPSSLGQPSLNLSNDSKDGDEEEEEGWVKLSDGLEERTKKFSVQIGFSAFFVFCKGCASLERAKLRAYCRMCKSSAIIFRREPQQWDDVKETNSIRVFCHQCDSERDVFFRFKCVKCDESASPLHHISRNSSLPPSGCVICGSHSFPLGIRLRDCAHFSCVQCFVAYAEELLSRMCLKWHPQVGFTIGCPVYGCTSVVSDVHTLYLLGKTSYDHYQQIAAQLFFSAQIAERAHCPWSNCGAAFFVEETEDKQTADEMVLCPECCRLFCLRCRGIGCKCTVLRSPADDESTSLINRTTKNCPHCAAPTERNGGCAHIHCTQCQSEWCFICLKVWNDECQWDHWFE